MLDRILAAMAANPSIAIVYPDDPNIVNWRGSRPAAENLARRMGIFRLPDQINFPVDGMFWMRGSALERFVALDLGWNDYPAEPLAAAAPMLEALKRLFGVVPVMDGLSAAVTNVRGLTR
jgi:lipopolysaccharide biosynthesis protein